MPSIAIVILNWNGIKDTLACYDSLKKQSFKDFTTRKHYAGKHSLAVIVNGEEKAVVDFVLAN